MGDEDRSKTSANVEVLNPLGIHARPAAIVVHAASRHACDVWIERDGARVNAKSVMALLTLAASQGPHLKVVCAGVGADEALRDIVALFVEGFGELDEERGGHT